MDQTLKERIAIVTGAAQGAGRGVALGLARRGATVVIADIQRGLGESVRGDLRAQGLSAEFCATDLFSEDSVRSLVATVGQRFGRIDIVASCAGIYPVEYLEPMTTAQWNRVLTINLTAPFWLTTASVPYLRQSKCGRIICTTTVTGPDVVLAGMAHYGASKAGLEGFMRTAALELAPYRITVNAVAPGAMLTPGLEKVCTAKEIADIAKRIPLGRLAMPSDIAAAYCWLASDEAEYFTGIVIRADGGYVLPEPAAVTNVE